MFQTIISTIMIEFKLLHEFSSDIFVFEASSRYLLKLFIAANKMIFEFVIPTLCLVNFENIFAISSFRVSTFKTIQNYYAFSSFHIVIFKQTLMPSSQELCENELPNKPQVETDPTLQKLSIDHQEQNFILNNQFSPRKVEPLRQIQKVVKNAHTVSNEILKPTPRKRRCNRKGHWSLQQNSKYYLFLRSHLSHFRSRHLRRLEKIFKQMSSYLGTRTANQCRSHHQKQQKKYVRLGVLMSSLYQLTKQHPLLLNQPPFSRLDARYRQLLNDSDVKEIEQGGSIDLNENKPLIVYQMPEALKIISHEEYFSMMSKQ